MKWETILIIGLFFVTAMFFIVCIECDSLKTQAVQRGYAEYNSTNGNWQWKSLDK